MSAHVSRTKPKRAASTRGCPLHEAKVIVRGASAEQIALCDSIVAGRAWCVRLWSPGVYVVRQEPLLVGDYGFVGADDRKAVERATEDLARDLRFALALGAALEGGRDGR
jgi:hypothetical protein